MPGTNHGGRLRLAGKPSVQEVRDENRLSDGQLL